MGLNILFDNVKSKFSFEQERSIPKFLHV